MRFFGQPTKNGVVFSNIQGSPWVSPVTETVKGTEGASKQLQERETSLAASWSNEGCLGAGRHRGRWAGGADFTGQKEEPKTLVWTTDFYCPASKTKDSNTQGEQYPEAQLFLHFNLFSFFVTASLFLKSILAGRSGFSTMDLLGCPSPYSHVLQILIGLFLKKSNKTLP